MCCWRNRGRQRGPSRSLVRLRLPRSLLRLLSTPLWLQELVGWLLTPRKTLGPPQRAAFFFTSLMSPPRAAWLSGGKRRQLSSIVAKWPLEGAYAGRMLCKSHRASPSAWPARLGRREARFVFVSHTRFDSPGGCRPVTV